nr:GNAT family N-acetyltransferase [Pumilibacter muris]
MAIMESHLKQLKPNLLKIAVKNQTAGYVYYKEEDTKIIVDVFTLLPEYRNNGLGSLILQGFIKKADELNKPIFLDTFKSNPAKKFYERNGFVVVDENSSHYILRYGKAI